MTEGCLVRRFWVDGYKDPFKIVCAWIISGGKIKVLEVTRGHGLEFG